MYRAGDDGGDSRHFAGQREILISMNAPALHLFTAGNGFLAKITCGYLSVGKSAFLGSPGRFVWTVFPVAAMYTLDGAKRK